MSIYFEILAFLFDTLFTSWMVVILVYICGGRCNCAIHLFTLKYSYSTTQTGYGCDILCMTFLFLFLAVRTFVELDNVKAVVSIGCCYNLLSEDKSMDASSQSGFPVSSGIKSAGLSLGKYSRDLACQVAFITEEPLIVSDKICFIWYMGFM